MGAHARAKRIRHELAGRLDRKHYWPKGHSPKAVRGQSGRSVLIVNSGLYAVTAKIVGTRNSPVCDLTEHHMRVHRVPETAYGVYSFPSKRAMKRWLVSWHSQGTWKAKLRDFKIEWL